MVANRFRHLIRLICETPVQKGVIGVDAQSYKRRCLVEYAHLSFFGFTSFDFVHKAAISRARRVASRVAGACPNSFNVRQRANCGCALHVT